MENLGQCLSHCIAVGLLPSLYLLPVGRLPASPGLEAIKSGMEFSGMCSSRLLLYDV